MKSPPQIPILNARLFLTHLQLFCECFPNRRIFDSFRSEKHIPCSMACQTPEPEDSADVRKNGSEYHFNSTRPKMWDCITAEHRWENSSSG